MLKRTAKVPGRLAGFARVVAGSGLIAFIASIALIAPQPARGQDTVPCANDTDQAPTNVTFPGCPNPAECPTGAGLKGLVSQGGQVVSYFTKDDIGPCDAPLAYQPNRCEDSRATCITNARGLQRCSINLLGLLYKPSASASPKKHAPAVVLVPGSTACSTSYPGCVYIPERFCGIKTFLLANGYVVLEALPKGYGLNPALQSTGLYVDDLISQQVARGEPCTNGQEPGQRCGIFDLEDEGKREISHAVEYVKSQSFVDADRIAVLGHSLGGIRTLALNTLDLGQRAVVTIAPDSESWCANGIYNFAFQNELFDAIDQAKAPIYVLQPRNDVNLNSVVEFSHRAGLNRQQFQAAIFPRVRDASGVPFPYGDWAHSCFVSSQDNVDVWAPTVVDFIQRYGVK